MDERNQVSAGMIAFYQLSDPSELERYGKGEYSYGQLEWAKQYGLAEWTDDVKYPFERVGCPVNPQHGRLVERVMDLHIVLPSPRVGDFTWTWYSDCLITDRVLGLFLQAGLTGFRVRPVVVERIKRLGKRRLEEMPRLWEIVVVGKGGDARPESGIRIIYRCETCGFTKYSSYNGFFVDESQWDGSDFFTINGYPNHILVTERTKDLIIAYQLTNCALIPAEKVRWPDTVPRPEDFQKSSVIGPRGHPLAPEQPQR